MKKVLVTGAGGFIGHHLVKALKAAGVWVRGVDIVSPEWETSVADEFMIRDLRNIENCLRATQGVEEVYNLAADMGGIGYITQNLADVARNNVLINTHMLEAAHRQGVRRYLFSSSACVYPSQVQNAIRPKGLHEADVFPADPEPGYGWEKLFSEQLGHYYLIDKELDNLSVRFHNVYGPLGTYDGGREKAPAALCRKVSKAILTNEDHIDVWGDGQQTRSFMYIDDCVEGLMRLMAHSYTGAINLGSNEMVSIRQLADTIVEIAGVKHMGMDWDLTGPQGVRHRNSNNERTEAILGWSPRIPIREGIVPTFEWIYKQVSSG